MREKILIHIIIFLIIFILIYYGFPCPFKFIFHIPCPACGTLHALKAFLHLDFCGYVNHNIMAIPIVTACWMGIHRDSIFKKNRIIDIIIIISSIFLNFSYIFKIYVDFFINK